MNPVHFPWFGRLVVIAPECMGLRSLTALALIALWLVFRNRRALGFWKSALVLASAALIGFSGNLLRIGVILLVAILFPDFAFGPLHDVIGFLIILADCWILDFIVSKLRGTPGDGDAPTI